MCIRDRENLKLIIEDMKRTQFVINTNISGEPADGYVVGTVTPSQNVVRVSGPESIINQIDHVDATVDIRDTVSYTHLDVYKRQQQNFAIHPRDLEP